MAVQWLGLCWGPDLIPGRGTRIQQAPQSDQKRKKKKIQFRSALSQIICNNLEQLLFHLKWTSSKMNSLPVQLGVSRVLQSWMFGMTGGEMAGGQQL